MPKKKQYRKERVRKEISLPRKRERTLLPSRQAHSHLKMVLQSCPARGLPRAVALYNCQFGPLLKPAFISICLNPWGWPSSQWVTVRWIHPWSHESGSEKVRFLEESWGEGKKNRQKPKEEEEDAEVPPGQWLKRKEKEKWQKEHSL